LNEIVQHCYGGLEHRFVGPRPKTTMGVPEKGWIVVRCNPQIQPLGCFTAYIKCLVPDVYVTSQPLLGTEDFSKVDTVLLQLLKQ
jgi:hypothetical protein